MLCRNHARKLVYRGGAASLTPSSFVSISVISVLRAFGLTNTDIITALPFTRKHGNIDVDAATESEAFLVIVLHTPIGFFDDVTLALRSIPTILEGDDFFDATTVINGFVDMEDEAIGNCFFAFFDSLLLILFVVEEVPDDEAGVSSSMNDEDDDVSPNTFRILVSRPSGRIVVNRMDKSG
jgi:hypothetical protein